MESFVTKKLLLEKKIPVASHIDDGVIGKIKILKMFKFEQRFYSFNGFDVVSRQD